MLRKLTIVFAVLLFAPLLSSCGTVREFVVNEKPRPIPANLLSCQSFPDVPESVSTMSDTELGLLLRWSYSAWEDCYDTLAAVSDHINDVDEE